MDEDFNFKLEETTTDERIKGNPPTGFRSIPLTGKALATIEKTHQLHPDTKYRLLKYPHY